MELLKKEISIMKQPGACDLVPSELPDSPPNTSYIENHTIEYHILLKCSEIILHFFNFKGRLDKMLKNSIKHAF